jgi:transposase
MNPSLKESLLTMKPKENSDQRKSRLRREAKQAKEAEANTVAKATTKAKASRKAKTQLGHLKRTKPSSSKPTTHEKPCTKTTTKPRRARKPVSAA